MSDVTPAIALTDALVAELGAALGAMLGAEGTVAAAAGESTPGWLIAVTVGEPSPGSVTFGLAADDCAALAKAITGDEAPANEAIADLLREVLGQAVGSVREKPAGKGVLFCVETPTRAEALPEGAPRLFTVALSAELAPTISTWAQFDAVAPKRAAAAPAPAVKTHASGGRRGRDDGAPSAVPANLDVILDIDLPLSVRFGQTDLTLDALTRLGPGSVIDLGRSPDDPVEVLVNGRLVARAEVVVVGGNYGVRIIEVVSAADRVRSLSA